MNSINQVIITGNVGAAPEYDVYESGHKLLKFSVAIHRSYSRKLENGNTETVKEVSWLRVKAWGGLAEVMKDHLASGTPVVVHGSLRENRWTDKESGAKRSSIELNASDIQRMNLVSKKSGTKASSNDVKEASSQTEKPAESSAPDESLPPEGPAEPTPDVF